MIIGGHKIILAIPPAVWLQPVLKHLKIAIVVVSIDDVCLLVKPDMIPFHQRFRRHMGIIKIVRIRQLIMYRAVFLYLRYKWNFHFLWRINGIMLLRDSLRLLLYQYIDTIGHHTALSPVIIGSAAPVGMYRCHIPICVILFYIPL